MASDVNFILPTYLVDRRLADWAQRVREKSNRYLLAHRLESEERHDLEVYLELLQEVQTMLSAEPSDRLEVQDPNILAGIQLLQSRFPELSIEPTDRSLAKVAEEIEAKIDASKSDVERTIEEWLKRIGTLDDMEDAYLQVCAVIAGTCVGIAGKRNLPERFDWVIVDEAGRATPSEILIPLVRAEHSILVGDHKQLPPVVEHELYKEAGKRTDIDPFWLRKSLFEYLFERLGPDQKDILNMQYRMHPHIANLISGVFYHEEKLETGVSPEERTHGWKRWPSAVVWYSTSQLDNRFEQTNDARSKFNLCEANTILSQLTDLDKDLFSRGERKTVAVITGYIAQVELLSHQLETQDKSRWKAITIEINTVDAFQGREEDIVFYSVVRSNPKREIGFLSDCKRLNVALSRARELLFIVGDHRMVASANTRDEVNPFRDVLAHFLSHPAECTLVEARNDTR